MQVFLNKHYTVRLFLSKQTNLHKNAFLCFSNSLEKSFLMFATEKKKKQKQGTGRQESGYEMRTLFFKIGSFFCMQIYKETQVRFETNPNPF